LLSIEIAHSGLQQILQGEHPEELTGIVACDDRKPRESSLGHSVDHYTQWFVRIRHDGMCLYNLSELALVSALVRVQ
jgi:hypothetical protein